MHLTLWPKLDCQYLPVPLDLVGPGEIARLKSPSHGRYVAH